MSTFNEIGNKAHSNKITTKAHQMTWLFVAFVFAFMMYPGKAHAQVIGTLEANIPFEFHAGTAQLPPGEYSIRMLENSGLQFMQIVNRDNSSSTMFQVHEIDLSSAPTVNELVFNKYGDHYFLAQVFDEGDPSGSEAVESNYEKTVSKAAAESKVHVALQHRQQQGE